MKFPAAALAALLLAPDAHAFRVPSAAARRSRAPASLRMVGRAGWENDDFMASLGGDAADREDANDKYYKKREANQEYADWMARQAAENEGRPPSEAVTPAFVELPGTEEPETGRPVEYLSGGGSRMAAMMNKTGGRDIRPPDLPRYEAPPPAAPAAAAEAPAAFAGSRAGGTGFADIAVVPAGVEPPPRPAVRKGEESFTNSADLYFAQLKADSSQRQDALLRGDREGHQEVWVNPQIKELEGKLAVNPFLAA